MRVTGPTFYFTTIGSRWMFHLLPDICIGRKDVFREERRIWLAVNFLCFQVNVCFIMDN